MCSSTNLITSMNVSENTPAAYSSATQRLSVAVHKLMRKPSMVIGGFIFLLILLGGIFAPVLSPYDPIAQNAPNRLQGISITHLLGTDDLGRDIYTRLLYGARTVLFVAFISVIFALVVGTILGMISGYHGGWLEVFIMRAIDIMLAFPLVLLAIVIVIVLGTGVFNLILAIGISQVPLFSRLAHSLTLSVRHREFVQAAKSIGASDTHIVRLHILPNIISPLIVQMTTTMAVAILSATALNFLGFGIQPPTPDWGAMVSDFRRYVFDQPQLPLYPGTAIALTVLSLNMLTDGLIDLIDPTARQNFI